MRWVGAGLGVVFGGLLWGVVGFIVGLMIEYIIRLKQVDSRTGLDHDNPTGLGGFQVTLLLVAVHMKRPSRDISIEEKIYMRKYFMRTYGLAQAEKFFKRVKRIVKHDRISAMETALELQSRLNHSMRLKLIDYLFSVARSTGQVTEQERMFLYGISKYLKVNGHDFKDIRLRYMKDGTSAYVVLGLPRNADAELIKSHYRRMVKKYHPDRVVRMGEPHITQAKERFQKIQQAYEHIKRERGL